MEHQNSQKYTCPMHPQIIKDAPGKCPLCGMTLVPLVKPGGHEMHESHAGGMNDFKKRFYVVLVMTVPIMLLSQMIQHWLGIHISFPGSNYILLGLSTFVFFYGGWPFLKGLRDGNESKESRNDDTDRFCHYCGVRL
jgi:P-type Cu2+ transporter